MNNCTVVEITGRYEFVNGFVHLFANNTIYTIPLGNPADWSCRRVGERTSTGHILTQELYDRWYANDELKVGTFELEW